LPPERSAGFAALPDRDFGAVLRGLAAFFATFADFLDVLPAIVLTPTDGLIPNRW
jgi:hypothetical protein